MRVTFDKAFYQPGDVMKLRLNPPENSTNWSLKILKFDEAMISIPATNSLEISVKIPMNFHGGYGIDVEFLDSSGKKIEETHRGIMTLKTWLERPIYGYLTDFHPRRFDIERTMDFLAQYHINALQYYDWMYDYGKLVYEEGEKYRDAWSRKRLISNQVLKDLISAGHKKNIFSMAYVSIYGGSMELALKNPKWALYIREADKWRILDFHGKIAIMNINPDCGWTKFLLRECEKTISFGFDGIHFDQYGYPKDGTAAMLKEGKYIPYPTSKGFCELINFFKKHLKVPIFFNYVNNWPEEIQQNTQTDAVYIEPWECCPTYMSLFETIRKANKKTGKNVILAAYIEGNYVNSILLTDATIFSSGGQRLEIGEYKRILTGPYFPQNYVLMNDQLAAHLLDYYDFFARYQDFFQGEFVEIKDADRIVENGWSFPRPGKIWVSALKTSWGIMLNFVNFVGIRNSLWRNKSSSPHEFTNINISIPAEFVDSNNPSFFFASADGKIKLSRLEAQKSGEKYILSIPYLWYWSSILIKN